MEKLEQAYIEKIAVLLSSEGRTLNAYQIIERLENHREKSAAAQPARRVKKYDHRCDYEEGERIFIDNRYGKSLATVKSVIRQPPTAICDKAILEFDNPEYRARWSAESSTPYFAIHTGRTNATAPYVEVEDKAEKARNRRASRNASAEVRLAAAVDEALSADPRFVNTASGWQLQDAPPAHGIVAEWGGRAHALPQGSYRAPLLHVLDDLGEATIEDLKAGIRENLPLGPADWEMDSKGKIVWIARLHAMIKHLKRVGAIDSPRREVYRRIHGQKRTA